jgi:hypothetical protein
MRKKRRKTKKHSPEWKKVVKLVGDLKATKRLIRYAGKMDAPEPGRTLVIGYLNALGARIAHEATEAVLAWEKTRESK